MSTKQKIAVGFYIATGLTCWAGIWWVNAPDDGLRYFLQAALFAVVGVSIQEWRP